MALSHESAEAPRQEASGLEHRLRARHIRMIAIGGAIGTGLFLGTGGRLQITGPALILSYLACGIAAFLIMRALGELIVYRPTSGSFVSYAREFLGEPAAFSIGWIYYFVWAAGGIVDITAVAIYLRYWQAFAHTPQWVLALGALTFVSVINFRNVKWFGELEFWLSLLKVAMLTLFIVIGLWVIFTRTSLAGHMPGPGLIRDTGGMFPHGVLPAVLVMQGVMFAYASVELVGIAAGEAEEPRKVVPKAINGVIWRIGIFYIGSITLLVMLLPWSSYRADQSPFVTVFNALGIRGAGAAMNAVVMTAALSSLNSGIYATGRVLRSLAIGGSAPRCFQEVNAAGVPARALALTITLNGLGVALNYLLPSRVFEMALQVAALGIISAWTVIILCQMRLRRAVERGEIPPVGFRMPGAPWSGWVTLAFLFGVLVLTGLDPVNGATTFAAIPLCAIALVIGWRFVRPVEAARGIG